MKKYNGFSDAFVDTVSHPFIPTPKQDFIAAIALIVIGLILLRFTSHNTIGFISLVIGAFRIYIRIEKNKEESLY